MGAKELSERAEKLDRNATPGPWQTRFLFRVIAAVRRHARRLGLLLSDEPGQDWNDAAFCAESRTLLPALAAELRKLTAALVAAEDTAKSYLATSLRLARERDAARAELRRVTELRPIAEAPRDGTLIIGVWIVDGNVESMDVLTWADMNMDDEEHPDRKFWMNLAGEAVEEPTHFRPLEGPR